MYRNAKREQMGDLFIGEWGAEVLGERKDYSSMNPSCEL